MARAIAFVDRASAEWREERDCVTCHTNGLYLLTRTAAGGLDGEYEQTRQFARSYLDRYVSGTTEPSGQSGAVEGMVATSALLAIGEMRSVGRLSEATRASLDHAFRQQDESGAWTQWLKCNWPPFEVDDHFGVTLMALAMGSVPDDYRATPIAALGVRRIATWLEKNTPRTLHQMAMTLWAAHFLREIANDEQRATWRKAILAAQREDGGWNMADFADERWVRDDGSEQEKESTAYTTALCTVVLLETGTPTSDRAPHRGLVWLRANQRENGGWFSRSPRRDGKHYISRAATNLAVLALSLAEERPASSQEE